MTESTKPPEKSGTNGIADFLDEDNEKSVEKFRQRRQMKLVYIAFIMVLAGFVLAFLIR